MLRQAAEMRLTKRTKPLATKTFKGAFDELLLYFYPRRNRTRMPGTQRLRSLW